MILFFDTETTGLVKNWDNPLDPRNPKLVQIGLLLANKEGRTIRAYSSIVKPNGFTIPTEAALVHGISTEMALDLGTDLETVLNVFLDLASKANLFVAHNVKFDSVIVKHALNERSNLFEPNGNSFCTMLESTAICKFPSKRGGFKWPKLSEVYKYFFNEEFKDTHDALADVSACKRVYFEGLSKK